MSWFFVILIGIPVLEAVVIVKLVQSAGLMQALMLIFITGVIGVGLARSQGFMIVQEIRRDMDAGLMPAPRMIDGVMILIAGALLITPGLITDFVGFALLVPGIRQLVRHWMHLRVEKWIREGKKPHIEIRRF